MNISKEFCTEQFFLSSAESWVIPLNDCNSFFDFLCVNYQFACSITDQQSTFDKGV